MFEIRSNIFLELSVIGAAGRSGSELELDQLEDLAVLSGGVAARCSLCACRSRARCQRLARAGSAATAAAARRAWRRRSRPRRVLLFQACRLDACAELTVAHALAGRCLAARRTSADVGASIPPGRSRVRRRVREYVLCVVILLREDLARRLRAAV